MENKKIDILNIGLIVLALLISVKVPFELFLFSYAFLGPLHYLTEINWLHEKNYFTSHSKKWLFPFAIASIVISIYPISMLFDQSSASDLVTSIVKGAALSGNPLILFAFLFSVGLIFIKKNKQLILLILFSLAAAFTLQFAIPKGLLFIGMFLPTLIHVFLFTFLFMLYGAKKSGSFYGYIASFAMLIVPIIIMNLQIDMKGFNIAEDTVNAFISSNMAGVSQTIALWFGANPNEPFAVFSEMGFRIQIFIAFAYTYHYLNWFSKTSIIGWKKALSKKRTIWVTGVWVFAVFLYYYDYKTGFIALFFLSFLHVFLEFPLNVLSIKGLLKKG